MNKQPARFYTFLAVVFATIILTGCSGIRHLEEGQYLLNKSTIKTDREIGQAVTSKKISQRT